MIELGTNLTWEQSKRALADEIEALQEVQLRCKLDEIILMQQAKHAARHLLPEHLDQFILWIYHEIVCPKMKLVVATAA